MFLSFCFNIFNSFLTTNIYNASLFSEENEFQKHYILKYGTPILFSNFGKYGSQLI